MLNPGTRIGPYEILSSLGAGGMGEVYRAKDTRLKRAVAIKVLPDVVAGDVERLARFQREAELLAALNHPNIAAIHGIEESAGVKALVMELVEGPTLTERIARGAIPVDEAIAIARQIAEGLEAAHEQGIVHRDLKPANVKLRPDGTVKILDFGLAKAAEMVSAASPFGNGQASLSSTTAVVTAAGMILGTPAYMSPEQARGMPLDKRTDVWAFGCVFFELLTSRRAFASDTVTDAFVAILEHEPQWNLLPARTPESIRRLLRRCLAKDVRARLHDIADARLEIAEAQIEPFPAGAGQPLPRRPVALLLTVASVAIVAATIGWMVARRGGAPVVDPAPDVDVVRLTNDAGLSRMPALSPDGRLLAYASNRAGNGDLDIWIQQVAGGIPLRLTDNRADDLTPDFSPDASQVVFRSERDGGGVYLVSALGGPARLIAPGGRRPRFSPDGSRIAYWAGQFRGGVVSNESAVYVVPLTGGSPTRVLPDFDVVNDPVWLPDGGSLLVAGRRDQASQLAETFDWWLARLDGTAPVKTGVLEIPLLSGARIAPGHWTSSGVLFSFQNDLWSVALSDAGRASGAPRRLTLGVGPYVEPAAGPNGNIVFAGLVIQRAVERASLTNATEPVVRLYADAGPNSWRASSTTDGSLIVIERLTGSAREIWTKNVRSGQQELVARAPTQDQLNATVSPDGARIAYTQDSAVTGGSAGTGFVIETSGGVPRKICDACELHGFLADNRRVLAVPNDGRAIRLIDARTDVSSDLVLAGNDRRLDRPHASPDDRWLAFREIRGEVARTFVIPLTPGRPQSMDGLEAVEDPTTTGRPTGWSLDSRVLYLLLDTDGFRCLWAQRIDTGTGRLSGGPFAVRHFHSQNGVSTSYGNAIDAEGFLYETADLSANLWKLTPKQRP